jgi:hypothetical protein
MDESIFNGCSLETGYAFQFVMNETCQPCHVSGKEVFYKVERKDVAKGTMTGTVYISSTPLFTFFEVSSGEINFTPIGNPKYKITSGRVNHKKGILCLQWETVLDGTTSAVVSYEYEHHIELQPKIKQEANFVKPTFKKFFDHEELIDIANKAGFTMGWDFNCALGDTIREKYESLYVKTVDMNNALIKKGAAGYFWITTSSEVASIFETVTYGFTPISSEEWEAQGNIAYKMIGGVHPQGVPSVSYCGSINSKWRLYKDTEMPVGMLLMGCNDTREDSSHYGRMNIFNYVI